MVMLVSNDPFWFGAGSILARYVDSGEWQALPLPSTFSLAAARLGWPLERCTCLGLHAKPLTRIRPYLHKGRHLLVLVRDGEAVAELAALVVRLGFADSQFTVLESLGGENERIRHMRADAVMPAHIAHPVAVGLQVAGAGPALPVSNGLPDALFEHDGQITKRPIRAITMATLAPSPGERLWDIGIGSGSVAIEWLLAHSDNQAVGFEQHHERAARALSNAASLGVDWLDVNVGNVPEILNDAPLPDAVFIGGGLSQELLEYLWQRLPAGVRIVANAVTLESEALLAHWHQQVGGELLRFELANAVPIGQRRGWKASYPIVQWSVIR